MIIPHLDAAPLEFIVHFFSKGFIDSEDNLLMDEMPPNYARGKLSRHVAWGLSS